MPDGGVVLPDVHVRVGVGTADRVHQQGVTLHRRPRVVRVVLDLDQAPVGCPAAATGHRLGNNLG